MRKHAALLATAALVALATGCEANANAEGSDYGYEVFQVVAPDVLSPRLSKNDWTRATLKCSSRAKSWNPGDPSDERAFRRACLESVLEEEGAAIDRLEDARRSQETP